MKKLLQLKLLAVIMFGAIGLSAQCPSYNVPLYEHFDSAAVGSSSVPTTPDCWNYHETSTSAYGYVMAAYSWAPANSGLNQYRMYNGYSGVADTILLASPRMNGLSGMNVQVELMAYSTSSGNPAFYIGTLSDSSDITTLSVIDTFEVGTAWGAHTVYLDASSGFNGTDSIIVIGHADKADYQTLYFDDINISLMPSCPKPLGLQADSATATNAYLSWNAVGSASGYTILYGAAGFDPATAGSTTTSTTNSVTLTGLSGASYYDFYVLSDCGSGTLSDTSAVSSFTTACITVVAPYTENFDNTPGGNSSNPTVPICWTTYKTYQFSYAYTYANATYANSAPNCFYLYGSGASATVDTLMLVTPEIQGLDSSNKMVSFYARMGNFDSESMVIGTVADPMDLSTFDPIDTLALTTGVKKYTYYLDSFGGYNGTHKYIAFAHAFRDTYSAVYIDDVQVDYLPACPAPLQITGSNTTSSSIDISFTSSGSKWPIEWGPTGFTQGTGTKDTATTSSGYTVSNLPAGSTIDLYLSNDCSPSNGVSGWTGPFTFTTLCNTQTIPYTENFNSFPPQCWILNVGTDSVIEYANTTTMVNCVQFDFGYLSAGKTVIMNSVDYDVTQDARIKFKWSHQYYSWATQPEALYLRVAEQGTNTWDTLWFRTGTAFESNDNATWNTPGSFVSESVNIPSTLTGKKVVVQFNGISGYGNSAWVDDFVIEAQPTCLESDSAMITGVTDSSLSLTWASPGGSAWTLEVGPEGFVQGTGSMTNTTSTSATVTGLNPNTCYDIYIQDSCAGGSLSPWYFAGTYCTECSPMATSVVEGFENVPAGSSIDPSPPNCWTFYKSDGHPGYGYTQLPYSWQAQPNSGTQQFYMYSSGNSDPKAKLMLISPNVIELDSSDKRVKFYATNNSTWNEEDIVIGTVESPSLPNTFKALDTIQVGASYSEYMQYIHHGYGYNQSDKYLALLHGHRNTYSDLFIDDVTIEDVPACDPPFLTMASNIATNKADISWHTVHGSCFKLEYDTTGFQQGSGNGTVIQNATSGLTITGLQPNTYYDVYIADCCDTNGWSEVYTFKTECVSQLSGTYTIGGTPGATNFATLDSATQILSQCGISGAVTFNFQGGSYQGGVLMDVPGASATNTITFNGSTSGDTITQMSSLNAGIDVNGTPYVSFNDLVFNTPSGWGLVIRNNSNGVSVDNCTFIQSGSATVNTVGGVLGQISGGLSVSNSMFHGGYTGVSVAGESVAKRKSGLEVKNCTFDNQYYYGISSSYLNNVTVEDNYVNNLRNTFSYGIYVSYGYDVDVTGNEVYAQGYGLYLNTINQNSSTGINDVVNNIAAGEYDGCYLYSPKKMNVYHNTFHGTGTGEGFYIYAGFGATVDSVDIRNNIMTTETGAAFYMDGTLDMDVDYNAYYADTANGGSVCQISWSTFHQTLNDWYTADSTYNMNSVEGDPKYVGPTNLRMALSSVPNDVGDNSVNVLTDIDGDTRPYTGSTTVDMGADEYEPVASDLEMISGELTRGECLSMNDTVLITVQNVAGGTLNMATTNIQADWTVTGPINSSGTITVNSGTLDQDSMLVMMATTVDMSMPGTYVLNAYLKPSTFNLSGLNDTLMPSVEFTVRPLWTAVPEMDSITSITDTIPLEIRSPLFPGGDFMFTELCQYKYNGITGTPSGGSWPTWLIADDYAEITGVPGSDLGGVTLEIWVGTAAVTTHTFPAGTMLNSNGTCIIETGQGATGGNASNFVYDGRGGSSYTFSSGSTVGYILKDAGGMVIDAAAANGYSFPASSGVTSTDWSGTIAYSGGTAGIRLDGADNNKASDWTIVSSTKPQDPNAVNSNVTVPAAKSLAGFTWTLNGNVVDTLPRINVFAMANGVDYYIATLYHKCDTFVDTIPVYVNITGLCVDPMNFDVVPGCVDAIASWTSDTATIASYIEYGPKGFTPGTGTLRANVMSPDTIMGLMPGMDYDFYLVDSCSGGLSSVLMDSASTTSDPVMAAFTWNQSATTLSSATVDFDGTGTTGTVTTYTWDFGDGNMGSGANATNIYTSNGQYIITLIADGPCDADTIVDTIVVAGINIEETLIDQTMNIYPNPTSGAFQLDFEVEGTKEVSISIVDALGREVYQSELGAIKGIHKEAIDLSGEAKGMYFIRISTDGHSTTKKLTIQ